MCRGRRIGVLMTLATVGTAGFAVAHDFWLVPDAFQIAVNAEVVVRGQTSSAFPKSESAVAPDRVTSARIVGAMDDEVISALTTGQGSLVLRHRPRSSGQKIVVVSVGWRHIKETAESFRKYLVLEGAGHALKGYDQSGQLPTGGIVRRYAKYAKTAIEVGEGPRAFQRVIGQPLEFLPLADPRDVSATSMLGMRLLFQGTPLAGAKVHAGMARGTGNTVADVTLTTTDDGVVSIPVAASGLWNVRTIHVVPAPAGADADWEVHWATFVFTAR